MKIDINTIKTLAENIDQFNLSEVAIETEGVKLVIKKEKINKVVEVLSQGENTQTAVVEEVRPVETKTEAPKEEYQYIVAPMIGTFYSASAPGNPPYVTVGQEIKEGATVCIVEAMKLMNEVKSDISGTVVEILAENGKIVKKGDKLFAIK